MASCLVLERPGRWRGAVVALALLALALPSVPLFTAGLGGSGDDLRSFAGALSHSLSIAAWVFAISFSLGLPGGVATALYEYPLRRPLLALATLPPLIPPFLHSIGWSYLRAQSGGASACVVVFSAAMAPLVLLTAYGASRGLSRSMLDAARLAGGEGAVLRAAIRAAAPWAALAAGFVGVLTLSDPGPGQVFGVRTAASEILTSFAAQYDFRLAAQQCLMLSAVVLACSVPLLWRAVPRLGAAAVARSTASASPRPAGAIAWVSAAPLTVLVAGGLLAPLAGLAAPLIVSGGSASFVDQPHAGLVALWAYGEAMRTVGSTVLYGFGAAAVSLAVALPWALAVGRDRSLISLSAGCSLGLLTLPSATAALGLARLGALAPSWADGLLRGRFAVCLALGLRLAPLAVLLLLRGFAATAPSWTLAAALHAVSLSR